MPTSIPFIPEPIFSLATDIAGVWIRGPKGSRIAICAAGVLGAAAGILYATGLREGPVVPVLAVSAAVLIIGVLAYQRALERSQRASRINEIEREVEAHPGKAKPAWDLASAKLEEYVARNLNHVAWIFVLVLIVMAIGFTLIGWGVYRVFSSGALAPSVLAAASGVVVEFIAATFLLIYRSTMQQAKEYVAMLERINAVGMAAQLLESTEDPDTKVRDKAKVELAKSLLQMYRQPRAERSR